MFCPLCASELKQGAKFCSGCGASIAEAPIIATPAAADVPAVTPVEPLIEVAEPVAKAAEPVFEAAEPVIEVFEPASEAPARPASPVFEAPASSVFYAPDPTEFGAPSSAAPAAPECAAAEAPVVFSSTLRPAAAKAEAFAPAAPAVPAAPAAPVMPAVSAAPAAPVVSEAPVAPVMPAAPATPVAPIAPVFAEPLRSEKKCTLRNVLQLLLLLTSAAAVAFLFLGIFGYKAGEYNNRFSLFGLCTPFTETELKLLGTPVIAGPDFLAWDLLFYIVGGIAVAGLLFVLLAFLLKKPKLNIAAIVSNLILAAFVVLAFFAFHNAADQFLNSVASRLGGITRAYSVLTVCGYILAGLCAVNVVPAVLLAAFGGKKKAEPEIEIEFDAPMV